MRGEDRFDARFDSTIVIYHLNDALPPSVLNQVELWITEGAVISVMSRIEVLGYPQTADPLQQAMRLRAYFDEIPLHESVVQRTITLCQQYRIRLPNAWIAVTALDLGFPLVTRNAPDFHTFNGLIILNPLPEPSTASKRSRVRYQEATEPRAVFQHYGVSSGAATVEAADTLHPSLILMDVHLPGVMDGMHTAASIWAQQRPRRRADSTAGVHAVQTLHRGGSRRRASAERWQRGQMQHAHEFPSPVSQNDRRVSSESVGLMTPSLWIFFNIFEESGSWP